MRMPFFSKFRHLRHHVVVPHVTQVLVVDDDKDLRELLSQQFRNLRCFVAEAETIAQTIDTLKHKDFDLVMLDMKLPDGSGAVVNDWIRQHKYRTHVIVVSGGPESLELIEGYVGWIRKPFSFSNFDILL